MILKLYIRRRPKRESFWQILALSISLFIKICQEFRPCKLFAKLLWVSLGQLDESNLALKDAKMFVLVQNF